MGECHLRMAGKRKTMPLQWRLNISNRWMSRGTSEICPWTYTQYFMHGNCYRSWKLSSKCLQYPNQQVRETKSLCKVDSTHAQWWPKNHVRSSCHHLQCWRNEANAFLLTVDGKWMHSFDTKLKWWNNEWHAQRHWGRKLHSAVRVLWKSCTSCSSAEMGMCWTIPCHLVQQSMATITVHSYRINLGWLFTINNYYCLSMV